MSSRRWLRGALILAALLILAMAARTSLAIPVEGHDLNVYPRTNNLLISPPDNHQYLDGQWLGMCYASDGNVYFGSSTHSAHFGAAFFKYDPRTQAATLLESDITNLTGDDPYDFPQGKLHSNIVEANGWVYWATHFSSEQPGDDAIWPGTHFQAYCLATGDFRDYGVVQDNATSYAGVAVDPERNVGYVWACPLSGSAGTHIYRYDLTTGAKTNLGLVTPTAFATCFWFFIDQRGDVWFSMAGDSGALRVIRGATGTLERFANALPPIYTWDTDQVVSNAGYTIPSRSLPPPATEVFYNDQSQRWIMWMQPLADGDRAVFTEGYFGGRLYIFDSTKDILSGAAFTSVANIGYSDLGLAVSGNKVFYYQRASRGWYHQPVGTAVTDDWHLLSADLNPAVNPQIVDYGEIQDQLGRKVWRLPSMKTDNSGGVYMTGDWWTDWLQPGVDDGTYRYTWVGADSWVQYPRGEQFARANMADVVTDNFDDNTTGSIWYKIQTDPSNVWLSESNQQLNLLSTSSSAGAEAAYHSKGWRLDATRDFACRVDWQLLNTGAPMTDLSLRIMNDLGNYVSYSVNRIAPAGPKFEVKGKTAGTDVAYESMARTPTSGTLYISYDSILDRLYFSPIGYYRRESTPMNDWAVAGLVRGQWNATSLGVMLSGSVQGQQIILGEANFDNFVLDDGVLVTPSTHTVTVSSSPDSNVSITVTPADNNGNGTADTMYVRVYDDGVPVTLIAPGSYNNAGTLHSFVRWQLDGIAQALAHTRATFNVTADTDAVAVYSVPGAAFSILRQTAGGPEEIMKVDETVGNVFAMGSFLATSLDLAENFDTSEALNAGSVVVIDPTAKERLMLCRRAYDSSAAGIISYKPGLLLGKDIGPVANNKSALALAGRTPCKADATFGAIRVGDLLTTSPTPGHAMKADPASIVPGCIIGKALEPLDAGVGVIKVMVTLQ